MTQIESVLVTEEVAAARIGIPALRLKRMRCRGDSPRHVRIGRRTLYRLSDVDQWVDSKFTTE